MKKYGDYKDIKDIPWTKYKIIVPTEEDRQELMEAFKHMHDSDVDTDNIVVNQLVHEYNEESGKNNIIVDENMYEEAADEYYVPELKEFVEGFEFEQYVAGTGDTYEKKVYNSETAVFVKNSYNARLQHGWIRRLKSMRK